jgi:Raf kinase inhibitor-like YbhB/YbcL family protein
MAAFRAGRTKEARMTLSLNSPAFAPNGDIPKKYTCDGKDLAPPLEWSEAPAGTKSFALIVDDPDAPDPQAPKTIWVHWVLYDIPASVTTLPKTVTVKDLPAGTREGVNDWKRTGYGGPCPPIGRHRYFHKLYALDAPLGRFRPPDEDGAGAGHAKAHPGEGRAGWDLSAREVVTWYSRRGGMP